MIYAVTEWFDNQSHRYFFDSTKVDFSNQFESAYLSLLERAAKTKSKWVEVQNDLAALASIEERFSSYQDGSVGWKRLTTKPPCQVDVEVNLTITG